MEQLKKDHRYRMSAEVVVTDFQDGGLVWVRGVQPQSGSTTRQISKYTWEDLGPVLASGFYKDADGYFWRYDGPVSDRWTRHVRATGDIYPLTDPAPRFPLRKVEFGEYVYE